MKYHTILLAVMLAFFGHAGLAAAQLTPSAVGPTSAIVSEPRYPEPGEDVTLRLNDFSLNTAGASYRWFIDGTELAAAQNQRAITLRAPELGERVQVRAVTTLGGGATVESSLTLTSSRVDVLIEADTLVPSFYQGRPLPSSGSTIRVTALPFLGSETTNPREYAYTWKVSGKVVDGGSRAGMNSTVFSVGFGRNVELTVDITDRNGTLLVSKTMYVPIMKPELYFYPIDPLQGLTALALPKEAILSGEELRLRAEPYYVSRGLLGGNVLTEWELNNRPITNQSSDPQEITLRKSGAAGSFKLGFHIRNLNQLLQGVEDTVTIRF